MVFEHDMVRTSELLVHHLICRFPVRDSDHSLISVPDLADLHYLPGSSVHGYVSVRQRADNSDTAILNHMNCFPKC